MLKNLTMTAVLAALLIVVMLPIAQMYKLVLILLIIVVLLVFKRGYLYVVLGSRILNNTKKDPQKAWYYYEKAWKAGLSPSYTVMLGNLFIQKGDIHIAASILDSVITRQNHARKPNATILANASTSRSMAYYVMGDIQTAIGILQDIRKLGKGDKNLYINLVSFLLEAGRLPEAWEAIQEAAANMPETPGMLDNRGWYLLLSGDLAGAEKLYNTLIADSKPRFPEAYVHAAQVKTALGKISTARGLYEQALAKPFYQTSGITEKEVRGMLSALDTMVDSQSDTVELGDDALEEALDDSDLFDDDSPNTEVSQDEDESDPNTELDDDSEYEEEQDGQDDSDDVTNEDSEVYGDEYDDEEEHRN
ncbi:MAG: tetratricopeptide repeat protein [Sphaerochaetaceae bacterium]